MKCQIQQLGRFFYKLLKINKKLSLKEFNPYLSVIFFPFGSIPPPLLTSLVLESHISQIVAIITTSLKKGIFVI